MAEMFPRRELCPLAHPLLLLTPRESGGATSHLGELIDDVLLFNDLQPQDIHFSFFLAVVEVIQRAWSPYCSSSLPLQETQRGAGAQALWQASAERSPCAGPCPAAAVLPAAPLPCAGTRASC